MAERQKSRITHWGDKTQGRAYISLEKQRICRVGGKNSGLESQIPLKDPFPQCIPRQYVPDILLHLWKIQVKDIASTLKILSLPWEEETDKEKSISGKYSTRQVLGWRCLWGVTLYDLQPCPWAPLALSSSQSQMGLTPPVLEEGNRHISEEMDADERK